MAEDYDDDLRELKMIDDFIDGKVQMTPYFELEKRGCAPPFIEGLSDEHVTRELTNLVWNLADLGIYIDSVDHLTDRELYTMLLEFCDEPNMFFPENKMSCTEWSPTGSGSDADNDAYLRYYADDNTREEFRRDFKMDVPPKEPLPYPRPWIPVWDPYAEDRP